MKAEYKSKLNLENRVALQDVIPLQTPFLLYADPSSCCNFRCGFCPTGYKNLVEQAGYKRTVMDFDIFKKAVDGLSEFPDPIKVMRMNKVGEPLLNPNLSEMIKYAKNSKRINYIDFATNGALLTEELSEKIIDAGLDRLNVSIEGVTSEQYEHFCHAKVDFQKLEEQIKYFYRIKKNCELVIKIPSNYISQEDIEQFKQIFGDYCDRIFVENLTSIWPNFDINSQTQDIQVKEESQYGRAVKNRKVCSYIFYSLALNADGTVSACCPDWEQGLVMGNLKEQTLKEIWNSDALRNLQKQHLMGNRMDHPVCCGCGHIKYCQVDDIDLYADQILEKIR